MKTAAKCLTCLVAIILGSLWYFIFAQIDTNGSVMRGRTESDASKTSPSCSLLGGKKYVVSLSYWEQINMAVRNMLQLITVANDWGSRVVEPYTINSRLFGVRNFVIKRESMTRNSRPLPLRTLLDVVQLNNIICSRGLPPLASIEELTNNSAELVVVVHFVHAISNPNDLNVPANIKDRITARFNSSSVIDCRQLLEHYLYKIGNLLHQETAGRKDHVIKRYYCVDATKLISSVKLAQLIGINELEEYTVVIVDWHGYSKNAMVHSSSVGPHPNKRATMTTSYNGSSFEYLTLPHSSRVIDAGKKYLLQSGLSPPYISVHIRSEKIGQMQKTRKGYVASCLKEMFDVLQGIKQRYNISNVVICTDAGETGADSCINCRGASETLRILHNYQLKVTHFDPSLIGEITDNGFIGLVEMNILGQGEHLIAVGGGSFQTQTKQIFSHHHSTDRSHDICTKR